MEDNNERKQENFEDIDSIVFSADITNEEALLLQLFKEQQGKRLICPEAKAYQDFIKAYSSSSGYHIFNGDLETLAASDVVLSFGVWFQDESTEYSKLLHKILEEKKPKFVYMHPIEDATLQDSITQFIKYEVGSEEGVAALLAYTYLEDKELPKKTDDILEEFDIGYLSAESNVGEEELESMYGSIGENTTVSLILGTDLYTHPQAGQIAKLIALLERYAGVNVVCIPPAKNALGVGLICDLEEVVEGRSFEYNSCKEGYYVNGDKSVYMGQEKQLSDIGGLNNLAKTLGLHEESLIGYSDHLPVNKGFQILTENLKKNAVYQLVPQEIKRELILDEIDDLPVYDGALVYTYIVEESQMEGERKPGILYGSKQFSMATKLQNEDLISFEIEGVKFTCVFKIDTHMKGVIALNPVFDIKLSAYWISSYRFSRLAFEKINNQNIGNNDE